MSQSTVGRIWRAFGLQPHRSETFKLSTDPLFVETVRDIADHLAGLHIQGREQRRRPVALVVRRAPLDLPGPQRQERLRAIEGLHLRLLVDTQQPGRAPVG